MSDRPRAAAGRIAAMARALAREVGESRWPGLLDIATGEPQKPPRRRPQPVRRGAATLAEVEGRVRVCTACALHAGRTQTVFGEGAPAADLMFVGEGPGAEEDRQGRPFVGAAGELLDRIIDAMGLARSDVFIANVVKCRPPENRNPEPPEIAACLPYLHEQIALIEPKIIVALGKFAAQALLGSQRPISRLRGHFAEYRGIKLMPTFHPSYLLRNPSGKKPVWEDMQQVMTALGLPGKQGRE
jgi:uracil-DNA glycosylase family 4